MGDGHLRVMASVLQRVAADTGASLLSLGRIAANLASADFSAPPLDPPKLLIIASGPSLKQSLQILQEGPLDNPWLMSVNDFYSDSSFFQLRPSLHVLADPIYWNASCYQSHALPLLEAMTGATWPLTVFLPRRSAGSRLQLELAQSRLECVYYNSTPVKGLPLLEYWAFCARLGMPRAQNVLVAAIAVALWLGCREIGIVGADHGWHQELAVSETNMVMVRQRHSYDDPSACTPFYKPSGVGKLREGIGIDRSDVFSMREIFLAWAAVHDSYERLGRIATRRGVAIYNASLTTFIDAFTRVRLEDFLKPAVPTISSGQAI